MSKIIPFTKLAPVKGEQALLSKISVMLDQHNQPAGFIFGRNAFISFLEQIDNEFEKKVPDQKKAFANPAGKLIDLIEEHLSVSEKFIASLREATHGKSFIPLEEISKFLHV